MENNFTNTAKEKSNDELLAMVYQFAEWSPDMLQAVEKELIERQLLPSDVALRRQEIIDRDTLSLEQGKQASLMGQIFGWLGVLGLIGLVIGYNYAFSKIRSKYTGKTYYKYDRPSRDNGSYIFYISLTVFILYSFYKVATLRGNPF
jgi:hypothetical protein